MAISLLLILINIMSISATQYYQVNFNYNSKTSALKISGVDTKDIGNNEVNYYEGQFIYYPTYKLTITNIKNKKLDEGIFRICDGNIIETIDPVTKRWGGKTECIKRKDFSINIPYYNDARYLVIYNQKNKQIIKYDLVKKKKIAGTGKVVGIDETDNSTNNRNFFSWIKDFFKF